MARTAWQEVTYAGIVDPVSVNCPVEWQKAELAIIRIKINSRDSSVGKTDLSKIIVREWSGYWYLYKNNYQISNGAIDFKAEQIYFDRWTWDAEIVTQQLAQRVPLIETTQPEENVEELSEFMIFGGEVLSGLVANLDIPIVADVLQFVVDFFSNLSSDDLNYLPSPYRPDSVWVWFPVGKISLDIEFHWLGYSPVAIGAGLAELSIEDIQQLPQLPQADSPLNPAPQKSFEELAREQGFVLPSESPPVYFEPVLIATDLFAFNFGLPSTTCQDNLNIPTLRIINNNYPVPIPNNVGSHLVPEKYRIDLRLMSGVTISFLAGQVITISRLHKAYCYVGDSPYGAFDAAHVYRIAP